MSSFGERKKVLNSQLKGEEKSPLTEHSLYLNSLYHMARSVFWSLVQIAYLFSSQPLRFTSLSSSLTLPSPSNLVIHTSYTSVLSSGFPASPPFSPPDAHICKTRAILWVRVLTNRCLLKLAYRWVACLATRSSRARK